MVPKSLKIWFVVHFFLDITFGLPLLLIPSVSAELIGLEITQTLPLRLVGAALIGIGSTSLIKKEGSLDSYRSLLVLKIIWSLSAIIAISLSFFETQLLVFLPILFIFVVFNIVWFYYHFKLTATND